MVWLRQYYIAGRELSKNKKKNDRIYFMKMFAKNKLTAQSRFWFFLKKNRKIKKNFGEILIVKEIWEKSIKESKNYGVWLKYDYKSGSINLYKEYRDICLAGAVEQMYFEMAGTYRVSWDKIVILRAEELLSKECMRINTKQYHDKKIKFPNLRPIKYRSKLIKVRKFIAKRPTTSFLNQK